MKVRTHLRCGLLPVLMIFAACTAEPSRDQGSVAASAEADSSAVHLIVDGSSGQLFGAAAGRWLPADSAARHVAGGETYRMYALGGPQGEGVGTAPSPPDETCTNPAIRIEPQRGENVVALTGAWDAMPRGVVRQDVDLPVYREAVAEELRAQGIANPEVRITQILRVDLEGDGSDEVLVSANLRRGLGTSAEPGDYALVVLRRVVDDQVVSIPLREEYYPDGCVAECAPSVLRVSSIVDADGDGIMDVILGFEYYEGEGQVLFAVEGERLREVLSWRCGV